MLQRRSSASSVRVDAGDDAAVLADGRVVTVDSMVEGVHFLPSADPEALGHKLLAINVSDVIAMGAVPDTAFLAMSLPKHLDVAWLDAFAEGLARAAVAYGVHLAGGDTTRSPAGRTLSLTLLGRLAEGREPWLRSGARPGDRVLVTGTLGDAGAGWWSGDPGPVALAAFQRPHPPFAFASALPSGLVHAAMDLSDGLGHDLPRLCQASQCGARIQPSLLPASSELEACAHRLALQTRGGEDYQLLLTMSPSGVQAASDVAQRTGTRLTDIGEITGDDQVELVGASWPEPLFGHFSEGAP